MMTEKKSTRVTQVPRPCRRGFADFTDEMLEDAGLEVTDGVVRRTMSSDAIAMFIEREMNSGFE